MNHGAAGRLADIANIEDIHYRYGLYDDLAKAAKDYFSPGILPSFLKTEEQKADKRAMDHVLDTGGNAIFSESPLERQMGTDFVELLNGLPKETRDTWNNNNTINTLANANGMEQLLAGLQELIRITEDNGKVNVTVEGY